MEEIVRVVVQKTGMSHEQAQVAVQVVLDYLKNKLPAPIAGQLDSVLQSGGGDLGNLVQGLGGMFGGK